MSRSYRRSVLKGIGAGTAALVGGAGVVSASPGRGPPSEGNTIVDVAVTSDGFDVLVAAVQEAGLVDALSGNRQLTVFAPTDEAFNGLGISLDQEGNLVVEDPAASLLADSSLTLGDVLTYHVTPGRRNAKSVTSASKLPTLNGANIDVDGTELNDGQAGIVRTNIPASNGIVHVIDGEGVSGAGVLLP